MGGRVHGGATWDVFAYSERFDLRGVWKTYVQCTRAEALERAIAAARVVIKGAGHAVARVRLLQAVTIVESEGYDPRDGEAGAPLVRSTGSIVIEIRRQADHDQHLPPLLG